MTSILNVGEPAPWFSAATCDTSGENIAFNELAGRHIVLFFLGAGEEPSVQSALAAFTQRTDLFDDDRALLLGISSGPGSGGSRERMLQRQPGQLFLDDSSGAIARGYGVVEPGTTGTQSKVHPTAFILSPALQIVGIVPLTEPTAFAEQVVSLLREHSGKPAFQNAPVLIVPQVFDRSLCAQLIELYEAAGGREIGAIENKGEVVQQFDPKFRKRLDHYISDEDALQRMRVSVERRLAPMVYRAFQFPVTRIERYLVGCYDAVTGGYFRPHRDNTAPPVAHRRFALTINLNEGYEGGHLRFPEYGNQPYSAAPGDAIVFSCSLLHEVTPVTQHRRYAFVTFLYDEQSHRVREANKARADLSGR
ncbi:2OG-Fe(II) oxygenase [Microvirga alba]|uniref:2OG-Fe(II) oxygenase n=1 Tax=Microvirga alba TaxID=2791025 RepID=A0A931BQ92_9HYPH|nr:2OG-Fe(II) oxygenase [Microvirga alba]MBF9232799.1 2OG-Fe(II) oxygenase [Microvirga alba]